MITGAVQPGETQKAEGRASIIPPIVFYSHRSPLIFLPSEQFIRFCRSAFAILQLCNSVNVKKSAIRKQFFDRDRPPLQPQAARSIPPRPIPCIVPGGYASQLVFVQLVFFVHHCSCVNTFDANSSGLKHSFFFTFHFAFFSRVLSFAFLFPFPPHCKGKQTKPPPSKFDYFFQFRVTPLS